MYAFLNKIGLLSSFLIEMQRRPAMVSLIGPRDYFITLSEAEANLSNVPDTFKCDQ